MVRWKFKESLPGFRIAILFSLSCAPTPSHASQDFSCSPRGRTCHIYDRQLATGDQLGFFTDEGQLIATGKVTDMKGNLRSVTLLQSRGSVSDFATSYAMIDSTQKRFGRNSVLYERPSPYAISTFYGLTSMSAGSDAVGNDISLEVIRRRFIGNFDGFVKLGTYSINGTAYNPNTSELAKQFTSQSLVGLSGLSYSLIQQSSFTLRTSVGIGLAYTSAKIDGSQRSAESADWGYRVKSGVSPHLKGMLAAAYKIDRFAIEAGIAPSMLAGKSANSIGAGLLVNLN